MSSGEGGRAPDIGVEPSPASSSHGSGASQRGECSHNENLMCTATEVNAGPGNDNAGCLTYEHI